MPKKSKKEKLCKNPVVVRYYVPEKGVIAICAYHFNKIERRDGIHIPMLLPDKTLKCGLLSRS